MEGITFAQDPGTRATTGCRARFATQMVDVVASPAEMRLRGTLHAIFT
jgi:hypothetical protein